MSGPISFQRDARRVNELRRSLSIVLELVCVFFLHTCSGSSHVFFDLLSRLFFCNWCEVREDSKSRLWAASLSHSYDHVSSYFSCSRERGRLIGSDKIELHDLFLWCVITWLKNDFKEFFFVRRLLSVQLRSFMKFFFHRNCYSTMIKENFWMPWNEIWECFFLVNEEWRTRSEKYNNFENLFTSKGFFECFANVKNY